MQNYLVITFPNNSLFHCIWTSKCEHVASIYALANVTLMTLHLREKVTVSQDSIKKEIITGMIPSKIFKVLLERPRFWIRSRDLKYFKMSIHILRILKTIHLQLQKPGFTSLTMDNYQLKNHVFPPLLSHPSEEQ